MAERTRELSAANAQLAKAARVDPLTGLLNRRGFVEEAEVEIQHVFRGGKAFAIALADIDKFKEFNERSAVSQFIFAVAQPCPATERAVETVYLNVPQLICHAFSRQPSPSKLLLATVLPRSIQQELVAGVIGPESAAQGRAADPEFFRDPVRSNPREITAQQNLQHAIGGS